MKLQFLSVNKKTDKELMLSILNKVELMDYLKN
jgi:hypothetical protein